MAKKKTSSKKHRFKHVETSTGVESRTETVTRSEPVSDGGGTVRPTRVPDAGAQPQRDYTYVSRDIRRIALLAGSMLGLELVIYYALAHTALGPWVNNMVKL